MKAVKKGLIKDLRIKNKFKQHARRDKRYQKMYQKHENIKQQTVAKIESGQITAESQLEKVNKQLERIRRRMSTLSKKDLASAAKTERLLDK
jgi:hypothetical protein